METWVVEVPWYSKFWFQVLVVLVSLIASNSPIVMVKRQWWCLDVNSVISNVIFTQKTPKWPQMTSKWPWIELQLNQGFVLVSKTDIYDSLYQYLYLVKLQVIAILLWHPKMTLHGCPDDSSVIISKTNGPFKKARTPIESHAPKVVYVKILGYLHWLMTFKMTFLMVSEGYLANISWTSSLL